MWRAVREYHKRLPRQNLLEWLENTRTVVAEFSQPGLVAGSGCSGTDIWFHCLTALMAHWRSEYGIDSGGLQHGFAAEIDPKKQQFIRQQFEVKTLIADVNQFKEPRVWNLVSQSTEILAWCQLFGGGFSCKGNSKQNSQRRHNKGCIRLQETTSGTTFEAIRQYLVKARPRISWLENVPDVQQSYDAEQVQAGSDAQYIQEALEKEGFVVIPVCFNCRDYGSAAERIRWWVTIFDIPPGVGGDMAKANFLRIFSSLKIPSLPVEDFLLSDELIEAASEPLGTNDGSAKRAKGDVNWKNVHEKAYSEMQMRWPPSEFSEKMRCLGFKHRESEVIHFAQAMFPPQAVNTWEFFDTNHTFERNFRYPWTEEQSQPRNPWKRWVPTLTTASSMVCRVQHSGESEVIFKRLHGLECMRLIGWDLGHFKNGSPFADGVVTPELLADLAGNAWSAFAYLPLAIAAFGAAPASAYRRGHVAPLGKVVDNEGHEESPASCSDDSDSD